MGIQYSFKRYEKKFLLTPEQYKKILSALKDRLKEEKYGVHTICNIYYDTENYDLIRTSVERPVYKEKFRLRSYGVPTDDSIMFAEIKKKSEGVVYKRRVDGFPSEILDFVSGDVPLDRDPQIQREISWFLQVNKPVPKVFIGYERVAYLGPKDEGLRVTFDWNIRWRDERLDLRLGDDGQLIIPDEIIIMEVKTPSAIPLWLVKLLSENKIYPASFSKYGTCYQRHILPNVFMKGSFAYAE
ncbi:MAG: polyphosphate polymerase domain-containing protein [Oscillospiraceae bacterium]|nr:polyphosphate polymerase domain-containing protein [Oscillospiraceae bacterium]